MDKIMENRKFMKCQFTDTKDDQSDQQKGLPQPPLQANHDKSGEIVKLPEIDASIINKNNLFEIFKDRRSRRKYSGESLTLGELSFLLWSSQGVKEVVGNKQFATLRTVPSGGARHPFETYIYASRVDGLKPGIYRYLAISHELVFIKEIQNPKETINSSVLGQKFAGEAAAVFYWTCVPYRGEWRYNTTAHKVMLLDAGHMCQNLYLGCEAIGCGTCAIAAYDQDFCDSLLEVDGDNEFTVYVAPVGRV